MLVLLNLAAVRSLFQLLWTPDKVLPNRNAPDTSPSVWFLVACVGHLFGLYFALGVAQVCRGYSTPYSTLSSRFHIAELRGYCLILMVAFLFSAAADGLRPTLKNVHPEHWTAVSLVRTTSAPRYTVENERPAPLNFLTWSKLFSRISQGNRRLVFPGMVVSSTNFVFWLAVLAWHRVTNPLSFLIPLSPAVAVGMSLYVLTSERTLGREIEELKRLQYNHKKL